MPPQVAEILLTTLETRAILVRPLRLNPYKLMVTSKSTMRLVPKAPPVALSIHFAFSLHDSPSNLDKVQP